ncbi:MAG: lipoyl synthase [Thermoguttaceae bacterium]|nr:lipoyl synthase [Thermoguttaceae bacterium]
MSDILPIAHEKNRVQAQAVARRQTETMLDRFALTTICDEAKCPNRHECYAQHTATFLLLGDRCTRHCGFCGVRSDAIPLPPDPTEPLRVACAVQAMDLRHVVLTSVTRDDLPDGGAEHLAQTVAAIHRLPGSPTVEVLPSDLQGDESAIARLVAAQPEVYAYNTETVPRLYAKVRDRHASYRTTLHVFRTVHALAPAMPLKTSFLLGLGETTDELLDTWSELRDCGVSWLTLGQYLRPSRKNLPVIRYLQEDEFAELARLAKMLGFHVMAGSRVRSSYHAREMLANLFT